MIHYKFKWQPEMVWALVTAALVFLLQATATTDFANLKDWKPYLISLAAGLIRTILGAVLSLITGPHPEPPEHLGHAVDDPNAPRIWKP